MDHNHHLKDGYQFSCQICGSNQLKDILDLGSQPLADKLQPINQKLEHEISYPLIQSWCPVCGLNQLRYICPAEIMFGDNYNYKTGVTRELVEYQAQMAKELAEKLSLSKDDLVCDLGSNDGTLLNGFKNCNVRIFGVEPTDIAELANKNGIPTLRAPFGIKAAKNIVSREGKAKLATATNVFAHVQDLGDFILGLEFLLEDEGYFCFENHYLANIINDSQYDTIYHEHLRSLSLTSIIKLFSFYNFTVVDAKKTSRYGGNIRVLVKKGKNHKSSNSINLLIREEKEFGLLEKQTYAKFKKNAQETKLNLLKLLVDLKINERKVFGYSLPARAMTLINYVGISEDILPIIVEQNSSLKLNKYVPGTRIKIISNECLESEKPEYLLIFAWHLKNEIIHYLKNRKIKCKCIFPLPKVEIIEI